MYSVTLVKPVTCNFTVVFKRLYIQCVVLSWAVQVVSPRCIFVYSKTLTDQTDTMKTLLSRLGTVFADNGNRSFHFHGSDSFIDINTCFWGMNDLFLASNLFLQIIHQVVQFVLTVLKMALPAVQMLLLLWETAQKKQLRKTIKADTNMASVCLLSCLGCLHAVH